jgi:hypothetical protein
MTAGFLTEHYYDVMIELYEVAVQLLGQTGEDWNYANEQCGSMYRPGLSRVYKCKNCKKNIGRDVNVAKNILMKGILTHL